ncbi:MAG: hypothetical protein AcusKO_29190 [Acuticoccus sp.]
MSSMEGMTHYAAKNPHRRRAERTRSPITVDRRIEVLGAVVIGGFGICLAFPGDTLASSHAWAKLFEMLGPHGEAWAAIVMIGIAVLRGIALAINGVRGRPTSLVRFWTASIGAAVFSGLTCLIAWPWLDGTVSAPSTGMITYAALAAADYSSAIRAATDARTYRGG